LALPRQKPSRNLAISITAAQDRKKLGAKAEQLQGLG
jgi:hypothetical protein